VNVTGSLLIGFLARFGTGAAAMDPQVRAGLLIGFCGAFTTFSTYSYETVQLLADGLWVRAAAYALGSVLLSLVGTLAGIGMAERLL
jgi:CrcB protein